MTPKITPSECQEPARFQQDKNCPTQKMPCHMEKSVAALFGRAWRNFLSYPKQANQS